MAETNKKVDIIDAKRFGNYDSNGKEYFEGMRNAILEIFPTMEDGKNYDKLTVRFAEKFAFVAADTLVNFEKKITVKIAAAAQQQQQQMQSTTVK